MPSSGASWRIRKHPRAAPLDKEEPRTEGLHAGDGSNLPRSGKLRGWLKAQDDALDMYFMCGPSDATGADEYQPQRRPEQEERGPQGLVFGGEDAFGDY
jgi:hypothetical protein